MAIAVAALGALAAGLAADMQPMMLLGTLAVLLALLGTLYRPALGLAVLAFTYPFDLVTYAGPVKVTTSAVLMVILGVVLVGRFISADGWRWNSTQLDRPVFAFGAATLLTVLGLAGYWQDQMVGLLKALGGFLMFALAVYAVRTPGDVRVVLAALLATASVQAMTLALQVLTGAVAVSEENRAIGTVDDPNLFAGYLVLVTPLALAVGISFRKWWISVVTVGVMVAFSIALIATLSRSGWVGAVAGMIVLAIIMPERRWLVVALGSGVAATAILVLLAPITARIAPHSLGPAEMLAARTDIWTVAISAGMHHPLFGVGVANFVNYYPQFGGTVGGINHAHDIFLNMFVERGIVGFATFVAVLVFLFRSLRRSLNATEAAPDRAIVGGLIGSFVGYLVHALVEVSYYDYKVLLLFWLLVGLAAVMPRMLVERHSSPEPLEVLAPL